MTDVHLHIGQFYDMCVSPRQILEFAESVNIREFAVSSTSICEEKYSKVISEMKELVKLGGRKVYPVFWVTPRIIAAESLELFLDCGIDWKCVKVHPEIHPYWTEEPEYMDDAVDIARTLGVPLLVHTDERRGCYARLVEPAIKAHPRMNFILAHSRPLEEVIELFGKYNNVYSDTAFCPIEDIIAMVKAGYADRVLWGSDCMVPQYYFRDMDLSKSYLEKLDTLKSLIDKDDFANITVNNFGRLFK